MERARFRKPNLQVPGSRSQGLPGAQRGVKRGVMPCRRKTAEDGPRLPRRSAVGLQVCGHADQRDDQRTPSLAWVPGEDEG